MKTQRFWVQVIVCLLAYSTGVLGIESGISPRPQRPQPWDKRKDIAIGAAAPVWTLNKVGGETVALSEVRGKVVVLDF